MKQSFTRVFTILYLISSIGFGSTNYYCESMQETMFSEERSCCTNDTPETAPAPEHSDETACCAIPMVSTFAFDNDKNLSDGCCVLKSEYNQVDSSPIPFTSDMNPVSKTEVENLFHPTPNQNFDKYSSLTLSDPSAFISLPLLS